MFNSSKKADIFDSSNSNSLFGKGTSMTGDITTTGDMRIDGQLQGNLQVSGKLIIGEQASITGEIKASQAEIYGKVHGKLVVDELLCIKGAGFVEGDLYAGKLQIEPTATFNGVCHMSPPAHIIDIHKEDTSKTDQLNVASK